MTYDDLGAFRGVCACCFADTELRMTASRLVPSWRDRLDRTFVGNVQRTASCAACGATYPLRATDCTPAAATKRELRSNAPTRAADPATLSTGRDWRDTSVPV